MRLEATDFPDLYIIHPTVFGDERGFFYESYNRSEYLKLDLPYTFVQDNHSKSSFGVLRGLHYQKGIAAQTKLVRATSGSVLDVVVDIRVGSPTYLKSFSIELSEQNKIQLLIPKGFAHGFVVLSETAEFLYKCDSYYKKSEEGGILYNDTSLNIDWKISDNQVLLSEKDKQNPIVEKADFNFPFEEYTGKKLFKNAY